MVATLGTNATAAVGINAPMTWLLMSFATLYAVGTTVQVAQSIGAKNYDRAKRSATNGLAGGFILFTILFIVMYILSPHIPRWLGGKEEIMKDSVTYLRIWIFALIPMFLGRVASSILRGLGNTKTPMLIAFFINILNIIGNFY